MKQLLEFFRSGALSDLLAQSTSEEIPVVSGMQAEPKDSRQNVCELRKAIQVQVMCNAMFPEMPMAIGKL